MRRDVLLVTVLLQACAPMGPPGSTDAGSALDASPGPDAGDAGLRTPEIIFTALRDGVATPVDQVVYAEPFNVFIAGLHAGETVLVQADLWGYASFAEFVVGEDGVVDVSRDASVQGSYVGVEPEGLIWSMERLSNATANNYNITFKVQRGQIVVAERTILRLPMGYDAVSRDVTEQGLVGRLMVPRGQPRPVVVVVGGSEGGLQSALFTAAHVETMGYAALALAYFDMEGSPPTLTEIPLEYFAAAFSWLKAQPDVDSTRIIFMGSSRGGELALLVGSTFPDDVDAVIAHVGSGLLFGSTAEDDAAAWSQGGMPLPFVPLPAGLQPVRETLPGGEVGHRWAPTTQQAIEAMEPATVELSAIHVENIAGPALIVAGADDGLWPSCYLSQKAYDRLQALGHAATHQDVFRCLEDAGHLFGTPGWPTSEDSTTRALGELTILGGTPRGNGRAGRVYDTLVREFLHRVAP